jgi:hypothetical protein
VHEIIETNAVSRELYLATEIKFKASFYQKYIKVKIL